MAINLTKGQRIDVSLEKLGIGLGWDPSDTGNQVFDLDASCFMLGTGGKLVSESHLVFYNNKVSPDGAVQGADDDTTGDSSSGDDETMLVNLPKVSNDVAELVFTVTIHEYDIRRQNFGQVRNSFIRIYNLANNEELCKYELDEDFSTSTAIELGRLYRRNGAWKFEALGKGYTGGFNSLISKYLG
ncbi:MAG: TerD family protein [Bacteroidota bacterium]